MKYMSGNELRERFLKFFDPAFDRRRHGSLQAFLYRKDEAAVSPCDHMPEVCAHRRY